MACTRAVQNPLASRDLTMMTVRQTLRLARIKQNFVIRFDSSSDLNLVLPNPIRIAGGRPLAHMSFGTQVLWH
ncbi:MAG: hypothetical protein Q8M16_09845, partial [Pirellulaceae bacterium]|nr:hypothetical protein [Pirellulaceae bacterium]